jgi:hypothetical protein
LSECGCKVGAKELVYVLWLEVGVTSSKVEIRAALVKIKDKMATFNSFRKKKLGWGEMAFVSLAFLNIMVLSKQQEILKLSLILRYSTSINNFSYHNLVIRIEENKVEIYLKPI